MRYRYDEKRGVRLKTAEIVVQQWEKRSKLSYRDTDMVPIIVAYSEKLLREELKAVGGRWDPDEKVRHVPYGAVRGTELEKRILKN